MKSPQSTPPSDEFRERFGINLRECRKQKGISQYELALRAETALAAISLLELGKTLPRLPTFIRLVGALGVRPSELVVGIQWMPGETVVTPGSFDIPDEKDIAAEVAALRKRGYPPGRRAKR